MNEFHCEREAEILEALRCGTLHPEHAKHAAICAICADTLAVSDFFQTNRPVAFNLPNSDFLWWKAQLARKRIAMERATRSIALVRAISYWGAGAAGLWLVFAPGHLGAIVDALSKNPIWSSGALSQSALFLGVGTLVFTLLCSLYLARPEK